MDLSPYSDKRNVKSLIPEEIWTFGPRFDSELYSVEKFALDIFKIRDAKQKREKIGECRPEIKLP
ncbi:MAG: hypothetical protein SVM80_04025 [Halobacteriota archaeon]|nr:hypothetical protein [Halobacteriota archaeon]